MKRVMNFWIVMAVAGLGVLTATSAYAQQPLLQITSPANNSVATEGTTLTITVSADPSVQVVGVIGQNPLPDVQGTSSANQFTLTIPTTIPPGLYNLTAVGTNSTGDVESAPVVIDVEWPYYPTAITTNPPVLALDLIGDQMPIRVQGTFNNPGANGVTTLDITNSTQITYSSNNPQVATVNGAGMITAVGAGQTAILVTAGTQSGNGVLVTVPAAALDRNAPCHHQREPCKRHSGRHTGND